MSTLSLPIESDIQPALTFVARQPILDETGRVFGYELLYRDRETDTACVMESDAASARVLTDTILSIGFDTLTDGRKGFMNVSRNLLINEAASLAPKQSSVLELLETVTADPEVIDACRTLKSGGHPPALAFPLIACAGSAHTLRRGARGMRVTVQAWAVPCR